MSYRELRDAGVEYPASVASELELAGMPLERCYGGAPGTARLLGVRLDPSDDRAHATPEESIEEPTTAPPHDLSEAVASIERPSRIGALASRAARHAIAILAAAAHRPSGPTAATEQRTSARWLAPVALIAAASALALAIGGGGAHRRLLAAHRGPKPSRSAATRASGAHAVRQPAPPRPTAPASPAPAPAAPSPTTPVSPALAVQLEARGHGLLEAGQFSGAVPVLRQALAATGENLEACLEPVRESCLTYAYALYDLGRALRLAGQPAAAVPILERRLRIANQPAAVKSELALARHGAAGTRVASATG